VAVTKQQALAIRKRLKTLMVETAADHAHWTYHAVRPAPVPPKPWYEGERVTGDCSKGCQYLCFWGDAPDPMGNDFGAFGNSTTIWLTLHEHISRADIDVGDIVVFGPDDHACMIFSLDDDPEVWNFGCPGQPVITTLSGEIAGHPGVEYWFCRLLPKTAPPSGEKLRHETGFYSWVAWKLGEGPWKGHKPSDKTVRPNLVDAVPAVPPEPRARQRRHVLVSAPRSVGRGRRPPGRRATQDP
jgi:hypothetical protein